MYDSDFLYLPLPEALAVAYHKALRAFDQPDDPFDCVEPLSTEKLRECERAIVDEMTRLFPKLLGCYDTDRVLFRIDDALWHIVLPNRNLGQ